jgi:hypothetical protein
MLRVFDVVECVSSLFGLGYFDRWHLGCDMIASKVD